MCGTYVVTPVATPGKTCNIFQVLSFGGTLWFSSMGKTYEVKTKEIDNAKKIPKQNKQKPPTF